MQSTAEIQTAVPNHTHAMQIIHPANAGPQTTAISFVVSISFSASSESLAVPREWSLVWHDVHHHHFGTKRVIVLHYTRRQVYPIEARPSSDRE